MRDRPKYRMIFDDLLDAIRTGKLKANEQTPSERDLAKQYKVTRTTARRALSDLTDMGVVKRDGARGTIIVPERHGARAETLSLICTAEPLASVEEFLQYGVKAAESLGWGSKVVRVYGNDEQTVMRTLALTTHHLILAERLNLAPDGSLARAVIQAADRTAVIGTRLDDAGVASVICDDVKGLSLAIRHLRDRGHRCIAMACGHERLDHPVLQVMVSTWKLMMADMMTADDFRHGLIRLGKKPFDCLTMASYDVLKDFLGKPFARKVTGLICLKEEIAIGAAAACRDRHRPIPQTLSLIEYGYTPRADLATQPRTGINVHMEKHVQYAIDLMQNREAAKHQGTLLRLVEPSLLERETVGPAAPAKA